MRTPETLTAVDRATRLNLAPAGSTENTPVGSTPEARPLNTKEERYKDAARSAMFTPSRNATADLDPHAEVEGSVSRLSIHDIEIYRHNPRTRANPRYEEIKASIRADGITNMLTVTRPNSSAKYSPYGGGNSRLRIAKELYAEGDPRFETLTVVVKAWPGDAAVISAHLAENKNRGDTSFWEDAKGVASFKREFETSAGRILSAPELNKELRQRGLNFGLRMIQNFAFAVEHLASIGPWLGALDVNVAIRPALASYLDLAAKFDADGAVRAAIAQVLQMHGGDVEVLEKCNEELDREERRPVALDVHGLLVDLRAVVARALAVDVHQLPPMASALAQNARLGVQELRAVRATTPNTTPRTSAPPVSVAQIPVQRPLGGMLAPVRRGAEASSAMGAGAGYTAPNTPGAAADADGAGDRFAGREADTNAYTTRASQRSDKAALQPIIEAINQYVPIHDFMKLMSVLPYGYMVDLPQARDRIDDQVFPEPIPALRSMLWQVLAMMSGQFNEVHARQIPPDPSLLWTQARASGPQGMTRECLTRLDAPSSNGRLYLSSEVIDMLLMHAEVGPLVNQLLQTMAAIRAQDPRRFSVGCQPLFT